MLINKFAAFLLISLLSATCCCLNAQQDASPPILSKEEAPDTLKSEKKRKGLSLKNYWRTNYPSPKKAITLAAIPGLGQIYNKRYWKLPLVYGALGGVIYLIDRNTTLYNRYRKSYDAKVNENSIYVDEFPNTPASAVRAQRNTADKNRQLSWLGLIGFYLISAGDAFVDAHLHDFDVDETISIQPFFENNSNDNLQHYGIGITLRFGK